MEVGESWVRSQHPEAEGAVAPAGSVEGILWPISTSVWHNVRQWRTEWPGMENGVGRVQSHQPEAEAGRCSGGPRRGDSLAFFQLTLTQCRRMELGIGGEWRNEAAGIGASSWKLRLTELRRACIVAVRGPESGLRWSNGALGQLVCEQFQLLELGLTRSAKI